MLQQAIYDHLDDLEQSLMAARDKKGDPAFSWIPIAAFLNDRRLTFAERVMNLPAPLLSLS
jgi:hypothetical protein